MNEKDEKRISDIYLASFLLAKGYRLANVRPAGRDTEWCFEDVPQSAINGYYNGDDAVSARMLYNSFRDMKGLSYQRL